ncbi:helix-turn-helix domain-containing protein [Rhodococcus sp. HNM0569]|nr:helix-turn-helix domain-containing protein [Rhodococcus sp. HNM0569]NLU81620.1 helix-turn-helix domain-containing protein [Rhodococcus sp. HNM0569]
MATGGSSSTTIDDLRAAGPTVALWPTAGRALGISRTTAYKLARAGDFPVKILRFGTTYRVVTADLLDALGEGRRRVPAA